MSIALRRSTSSRPASTDVQAHAARSGRTYLVELRLICTINVPAPARSMPTPFCQVRLSPKKSQARTAICTSIVLLIMLDSTAVRVRSV